MRNIRKFQDGDQMHTYVQYMLSSHLSSTIAANFQSFSMEADSSSSCKKTRWPVARYVVMVQDGQIFGKMEQDEVRRPSFLQSSEWANSPPPPTAVFCRWVFNWNPERIKIKKEVGEEVIFAVLANKADSNNSKKTA